MGVSVTEPLGLAQSRTGRMLFKPFSAGKWFTLGFAAWLAQLVEGAGGGGGNFQIPGGGGGGTPRPVRIPGAPGGPGTPGVPGTSNTSGTPGSVNEFDAFVQQAKQFVIANAYWIIPVAIAAIALWVALLWVRARGKFIFLENVALDRVAIIEPWKRLAPQANSFFRFDLLINILMPLLAGAIAIVGYFIAKPDIAANRFSSAAITAIIVGSLLFIALTLLFAVAKVLAEDFLIPLMYLRAQPIVPAWTEFRTRVLPGNVGSFVLFYLMRIVLGIATAIIMFVGTCLTCCIAGLPYISTVFFLPIFVFMRCYSLFFLRQIGAEYNLLAEIEPVPLMAFPVVMNPPPLPPPNQPGDPF